jgi:pimeloyl-ACP methyl ester carboxylesterase
VPAPPPQDLTDAESALQPPTLAVHRYGSGDLAVLLHGGILGARPMFRAQLPLADRWSLVLPDFPGHGATPGGPDDFVINARAVNEQLLDEPVHLLGYSYGGLAAMLAAAAKPGSVRSLTLVEPPAFGLVAGDPDVERMRGEVDALAAGDFPDPRRLLERFYSLVGVPAALPDPLPRSLHEGALAFIGARSPASARVPVAALAAAPFPILVLTGGHRRAFEVIAERLVTEVGAERAVLRGAGHLVPTLGSAFNDRVERFWNSVR